MIPEKIRRGVKESKPKNVLPARNCLFAGCLCCGEAIFLEGEIFGLPFVFKGSENLDRFFIVGEHDDPLCVAKILGRSGFQVMGKEAFF